MIKRLQRCCSGCSCAWRRCSTPPSATGSIRSTTSAPISFFLFWIVAVSGLYLYAFFETGVADAYASVQALTQGQWFAGGIMRSVHRYASDAMVLTMLLHMLRHFAFDRFRGFRWFSWVDRRGADLAGLRFRHQRLHAAWDKLAQFVIVASFEWLDWLPIFGGTLMRNFIYPAASTTASSRCCRSCTSACRWWCCC